MPNKGIYLYYIPTVTIDIHTFWHCIICFLTTLLKTSAASVLIYFSKSLFSSSLLSNCFLKYRNVVITWIGAVGKLVNFKWYRQYESQWNVGHYCPKLQSHYNNIHLLFWMASVSKTLLSISCYTRDKSLSMHLSITRSFEKQYLFVQPECAVGPCMPVHVQSVSSICLFSLCEFPLCL